jgi:antitoxin component of MazEF toxin-antitoxin module
VKLQKQLSRKVQDKKYPKYVITIPPRQIEQLGWKEGEHLESEISKQNLVIQKQDIKKIQERKDAAKKAWDTRKKRGK